MRRCIIIFLVFLLISCEMGSPKTVALIILADRTDAVIPNPVIEDILPLLPLEDHPNTGVTVCFQNIGDVDYTPVYPLDLASAGLFDNSLERKSDITRFTAQMDTLLSQQNNKEYHYQRSSILFSVVDHLKMLNQAKAQDRYLLVYSDLVEFSDLYDSYANRQTVLNDPKTVVRELKTELDIPDLNGVRLYIKYHPTTASENRLFKAWVHIYQLLFQGTQLDIHIGTHQQQIPN